MSEDILDKIRVEFKARVNNAIMRAALAEDVVTRSLSMYTDKRRIDVTVRPYWLDAPDFIVDFDSVKNIETTDGMSEELLLPQKHSVIINGYKLELTCSETPEQYDVFKDGKEVGYLRLRFGSFVASYPGVRGINVFEHYFKEQSMYKGQFTDQERAYFLPLAIYFIDQKIHCEKHNEETYPDKPEDESRGEEVRDKHRKILLKYNFPDIPTEKLQEFSEEIKELTFDGARKQFNLTVSKKHRKKRNLP